MRAASRRASDSAPPLPHDQDVSSSLNSMVLTAALPAMIASHVAVPSVLP